MSGVSTTNGVQIVWIHRCTTVSKRWAYLEDEMPLLSCANADCIGFKASALGHNNPLPYIYRKDTYSTMLLSHQY
jgi:hypothetical protein